MTILAAVCVIGAAGAVFAQDDVENQFDSDPAGDIDDMDDVYDIDAPTVYPEKPAKSGKKSGKSGKSKSKKTAEAAGGDGDVLNAVVYDNDPAAAPKPPKSKSKSGKSDKPSAKEKTAADAATLKVNGLIAAGVDINVKENKDGETANSRVIRGEIELSARPVKKVRAEIGIEYNAKDTFVRVDKLYGQYNITDDGGIRVGVSKKSFGHEERAGLDERYFLKKSIINSGLEDLGFLDHDLTAAYRHDLLGGSLRLFGAFSWSVKDSLRYLQNYSAQYNAGKNMEFVLAGIVRHYTAAVNPSTTYAAALSFRHEAAVCVSEAEITVGTNPKIWKENYRETMLFGARLQEQFPVNIDAKILRRVVPVLEAAVYAPDIDSGYVDTQIRAGVTLGFAKNSAFQFRNNFGTVIRTENGASKVRRYRFDSEAVVIF